VTEVPSARNATLALNNLMLTCVLSAELIGVRADE
jgi:hypothetical protein